MQALIGKKITQTQAFLTNGTRIPVTAVSVPDAPVVAVKTVEKDGYAAVQIGYGAQKKATKPELGHSKKANLTTAPKVLREFRLVAGSAVPAIGDVISTEDVLQPGDIVKVTGISKGKGFAGVVKRHNFRGGPRTHGQSDRERAPGSIGQTTTPGRVYKGKRMAGRMGHERVSVANLMIIDVIAKNGEKTVLVRGLIPGGANTIVTIEKTGELGNKKFVPLQKKVVDEIVAEVEVVEESMAIAPEEQPVVVEAAVDSAPVETATVPEETSTETKEEVKE